jgi:hypothetical protein
MLLSWPGCHLCCISRDAVNTAVAVAIMLPQLLMLSSVDVMMLLLKLVMLLLPQLMMLLS